MKHKEVEDRQKEGEFIKKSANVFESLAYLIKVSLVKISVTATEFFFHQFQ